MQENTIPETNKAKESFDNTTQVFANLILAIETKNKIAFEYHKDALSSGPRTVLPHNVYWNKDDTCVMLDGFQETGDSKSSVMSFKQFDTKHIKACIILDDKFNIVQGYNGKSDRYNKSILGIL